ncbi:arylesterase [Clostridium sp. HV4-5-A1G]|nr:arylesterase [Clostridium sp. HV4-5-A1G]
MKLKVICIGDSLTYGYGLKRNEVWTNVLGRKLGVEVINKGVSGDTSAGMLSRLYNDVILSRPTHAVIMGGTNDLVWNLDIRQVISNLATIAFQLMQNCITPVFGLSVPICTELARKNWGLMSDFSNINKNLKVLNDKVVKFSQNYSIQVVDLYSPFTGSNGEGQEEYYIDGLHLNIDGNVKMADIIFNILV